MKESMVYDGFRFPDVGRMSDVDLCQVLTIITDYVITNTTGATLDALTRVNASRNMTAARSGR